MTPKIPDMYRGARNEFTIQLTDAGGNPIDISEDAFELVIKSSRDTDNADLANVVVAGVVTDLPTAIVTFTVPASAASTLTAARYWGHVARFIGGEPKPLIMNHLAALDW